MAETRHTFCRICESLCGLEVQVEGDRVVQIRPDKAHPASAGFACVKGLAQHELYDSPDRLLQPLKRDKGRLIEIGWEQALREIGEKVKRITGEHHPDAVAMYVGTAAGFSLLHPIFAQGFMTGIGSKSMYATATQDCANKFAVAQHMYGFPFTQPIVDIDRTNCLIITGANPAISKWSFGQVCHPTKRLKEIEARGGKVWIVDPRRNETAKAAGRHVFIRPDTDPFFFLAFLHEVIAREGVDRGRVEAHMSGFERLASIADDWTPERAAKVTHIPAEVLREMVSDYLAADGAAMYCSTGVNMGHHGSLAFWIQECINAITGNLDRRGGTVVGKGVVDFPGFAAKHGLLMRDDRSRVGNFASVNDAFPGGVLADEIETGGPKQVRALFVTGGNPLLGMPNAGRLRGAFEKLELLVALDILPSETASVADYVLPCTSPLQRPDLPFFFPLMFGMQSKPYVQATREVVPPRGEQRDESSIYVDLARACGVSIFGSGVAQRVLEGMRRRHRRRTGNRDAGIPQEKILGAVLRLGRQGSFARLADREPRGRVRPDHGGDDYLGRRVLTKDGKLQLAPDRLVEAVAELEGHYARELETTDQLKLITRRHITTHNTWTHNVERFVKAETNYLYMHPRDAQARGIEDGALVDVRSPTATVRIPVQWLEDLMPGTVAMPHGWGHQRAKGLSVASKTRGVNVNLLAADGPDALEKVSGMARLTGIIVEVVPAAGPKDESDWSGVASG